VLTTKLEFEKRDYCKKGISVSLKEKEEMTNLGGCSWGKLGVPSILPLNLLASAQHLTPAPPRNVLKMQRARQKGKRKSNPARTIWASDLDHWIIAEWPIGQFSISKPLVSSTAECGVPWRTGGPSPEPLKALQCTPAGMRLRLRAPRWLQPPLFSVASCSSHFTDVAHVAAIHAQVEPAWTFAASLRPMARKDVYQLVVLW
jgi:hypothetical protein